MRKHCNVSFVFVKSLFVSVAARIDEKIKIKKKISVLCGPYATDWTDKDGGLRRRRLTTRRKQDSNVKRIDARGKQKDSTRKGVS
jgi:hypothetical protein